MLNAGPHSARLPWFQSLLLRTWLSKAEQKFPDLLPALQPTCMVALSRDRLIGMVVIRPMNRRGSCWALSRPEQLEESENFSTRTIYLELLQGAIKEFSHCAQSWVLQCSMNDNDQLALVRELGFQPLKTFQIWSSPQNKTLSKTNLNSALREDLDWQPINRKTAPLLWPIEQASASSHLRQILDRQWIDLLDHPKDLSGILINHKEQSSVGVAGLLTRRGFFDQPIVEILRDLAWNSSLDQCLPLILSQLIEDCAEAKIASARDDANVRACLVHQGWHPEYEELMLGRSIWRRQLSKKTITATRSLESMLEHLQPNHPPLPTPSLGQE